MNGNAKLTSGPIGKSLIKLAVPMMFGMVAIFLFNIVDTFYVGMLGSEELAAMGFTFPVIYVIMSLIMGIGIGAAAVISKAIGKKDEKKVKRLTTHSILLALIIIIILSGIGLMFIDPLFKFLGAEENILNLIKEYMKIWYITIPFLVIPMVGNNALRAMGNTKTPAKIMITAAVINAIIDPLLIFGIGPFPRLELQGAAVATAISWFIIMVVELYILGKKEKLFEFKIPKLKEFKKSTKEILYIGIPTTATNMLTSITLGVLTKLMSGYGNEAVAALGVSSRLEAMAMIGIMALSAVMTPFVGQNFGAKKCDRIKKAISFSIKASLIWGAGIFILFLIFSKQIAMVFNKDPVVIKYLVLLLTIMPVSYGFYGVANMVSSSLNAINKPLQSAMLIMIRLFVFIIPLAFIGSYYFGFIGLITGITIGNILIGIVSVFRIKHILKISEQKASC